MIRTAHTALSTVSIAGRPCLTRVMLALALGNLTRTAPRTLDLDIQGFLISGDSSNRWAYVAVGPADKRAATEALAQGACAVVTLSSSVDDLGRSVRALERGSGTFVAQDVMMWITGGSSGGFQNRGDGRPPTAREQQVLDGVNQGLTNADIARQLGLSVSTVRTHLRAISLKQGSSARANPSATLANDE